MFSNSPTKVAKPASRAWLVPAACLAFVLLLASLFHVVSGQVEQAGLRQAQYNAAQAAISGCAASYAGAARRQCVEQVNAGLMPYSTYTPQTETGVQAGLPSATDSKGIVQAAFAHR
jgi:hypothetical protein